VWRDRRSQMGRTMIPHSIPHPLDGQAMTSR
jgi:hypothetical protein